MKRNILIILIILISTFSANLTAKNNKNHAIILSTNTFMYKYPHAKSKITGILSEHETVEIIECKKSKGLFSSSKFIKIKTDNNKKGYILRANAFQITKLHKISWSQENKKHPSRLEYIFYKNNKFVFKIKYKKVDSLKIVRKRIVGQYSINGREIKLSGKKYKTTLFLFKVAGKNVLSPFNFRLGSKIPSAYLFRKK